MNKVIVVAPHADDEIIGCGATIAKHIFDGDEVIVIIATNASKGAPELFSEQDVKNIRNEAKNAHKILGIKDTAINAKQGLAHGEVLRQKDRIVELL